MKKIESIKTERIEDCDPDTSYLGKYTDDLRAGVIVRKFGKYFEGLTEEVRPALIQSAACRILSTWVPDRYNSKRWSSQACFEEASTFVWSSLNVSVFAADSTQLP